MGDDAELRLDRLETQLAFQDQSLQELGEAVYRQEQEIERLGSAIRLLTERLATLAESISETGGDDEIPPHY